MARSALTRLCTALALAASAAASPAAIVDASGDFIGSYVGRHGGDLDVISASALLHGDTFSLDAFMDADIGTTVGGLYVWGVNRGAGTARFAAIGVTGVLFDALVILNQDGSGTVRDLLPGGLTHTLAAGSARISGAEIEVDVPDAWLPSAGFDAAHYTWNLWPRDGAAPAGNGQISDFAPDNSNLLTDVPEPATAMLLLAAAAGLGLSRRRRG